MEGLEQVIQAPSQNHNVVDVQQGNDHDGSIADTCMGIVETSTVTRDISTADGWWSEWKVLGRTS